MTKSISCSQRILSNIVSLVIRINSLLTFKVVKVLFSNMKFLRQFMLLLAVIQNFIILSSYSVYSNCPNQNNTNTSNGTINLEFQRLNCPSFLYSTNVNSCLCK